MFHDARETQGRVIRAIRRGVNVWEIPGSNSEGPIAYLDRTQDEIRRVVTEVPGTRKVYTVLECHMVREDPSRGEQMFTSHFARSKVHVIHNNFDNEYVTMREKMLESLAKFQRGDSGWRLHSIVELVIKVVRYEPLAGSEYATPLPKKTKG